MRPLAALTAAPRSVGGAAKQGQAWANALHMPGIVPPPTRLFGAVVVKVNCPGIRGESLGPGVPGQFRLREARRRAARSGTRL